MRDLPPYFGTTAELRPARNDGEPEAVRLPVGTTVSEGERLLIQLTLQHSQNNKKRAAEILGVGSKTLFNKLKDYGGAEAEAFSTMPNRPKLKVLDGAKHIAAAEGVRQ